MTTARRTSLIRHLHLDIGYERDTDPYVLSGAILEALERSELIDEMGIVFIEASSLNRPGDGSMTIYAPIDQIKPEGEAPPQAPSEEPLVLKVCPQCGKNGSPVAGIWEDPGLELCEECAPKPNVG